MKGAEKDLLRMVVNSLAKAHYEVGELKASFAVQPVEGGKNDTYGLDSIPEEVIKHTVAGHDPAIALITEETGKMFSGEDSPESTRTVLICDPTDRSIKMKEFLDKVVKERPAYGNEPIVKAFADLRMEWENEFGNPTISGASSSITAIRDGRLVFNAMVNYVTGDVFIADARGTRMGQIVDYEKGDMKPVVFSPVRRGNKFIAFMKKRGYPENLQQCNNEQNKHGQEYHI